MGEEVVLGEDVTSGVQVRALAAGPAAGFGSSAELEQPGSGVKGGFDDYEADAESPGDGDDSHPPTVPSGAGTVGNMVGSWVWRPFGSGRRRVRVVGR